MNRNKNRNYPKPGKSSLIYFQIGMIITLTAILLAFEWKTERKGPILLSGNERQGEIEMIPITEQPLKKKEIPKKPEPVISKLEVKDNTDEVEDFDFTAEAKADEAVMQDIPMQIDEPVVDDIPFVPVPQEQASFPGGYNALRKFLATNLVYSPEARELGIEGKIYVYFEVSHNGSISNIQIKRGLGFGLDEEVIRVLHMMPKWNPGKQGGRAVRSPFVLPVVFSLD